MEIKRPFQLRDIEVPIARYLLSLIDNRCASPCFIEIGACTGYNSYVSPFLGRWRGAYVEPVPETFERLKRKYKDTPFLTLLPYACAPQAGVFTFYAVVPPVDNPNVLWSHTLSSFDRSVVLRNKAIPNLESFIYPIQVQSYPGPELMALAKLDRLDALFIDTEGFDDEVLYSFDLNVHRPVFISMEHKHIRGPRHVAVVRHCQEYGYKPIILDFDTFFIQPDLLEKTEEIFINQLIRRLSQYAEAPSDQNIIEIVK